MSRPPHVLKIAEFRRLWAGQAISLLGDALYFLIFLFMVGKLTGDPRMVGYVGAVQALPFLIFSPFAGVAADKFDRRRIMLFADLASVAILCLMAGFLVYSPKPPLEVVFFCAFALSAVNAYFLPAKAASVPRLVPEDRLIEANSISAATDNLMPMIGLGFSGSVLGGLYTAYPDLFFLVAVLFNALTFLWSAACIARLPAIEPSGERAKGTHVLADLKEGLGFIGKHHVLKVVLGLSLMMNLFISPFMVVHIAANDAWFGGQYASLAWFEFAFMAGMVPGRRASGPFFLRHAGQGFIWGSVVIGALVALLGFARTFWPYLGLNLIAGLVLPFAIIPINTYMQLVVPDAFRGRVNSASMMLSQCVRPLAIGVSGIVLASVGLVNMFLVMGIGMGLVALAGLLDGPFRRAMIPKPAPVKEPPPPEEAPLASTSA